MQYLDNGELKHLYSIATLKTDTIYELFLLCDQFKKNPPQTLLKNKYICNAFFESSTRTRCSFELAEKKLGANVVNFNSASSSLNKGETYLDTLLTLQAMNFDALVIRHSEEGIVQKIAEIAGKNVSIINAGDGKNEHPTQALLDAYTISQHKKDFSTLSIGIFGDVLHSRVARSLLHIFHHLSVRDLRLIGPKKILPQEPLYTNITMENNIEVGLKGLDVIIMLRVQSERMTAETRLNNNEYFLQFGLTMKRLQLAKPDAIVMHPGPMNREVEIASEVADCAQSVILEQVSNGVFIRMASLAACLG